MMDEISNALRSLKMPGMAHYWTTMQETRQHDSLSLKDGLQLLIQAELDNRTTSRNTRLVKKARFRYQASIGEVIYDSGAAADPAPEGLEVRAVPTVAIELARIARYGETSATTLLRETLQADGLDPGTEPLFALAAVRQLGTVRAPDQREEE